MFDKCIAEIKAKVRKEYGIEIKETVSRVEFVFPGGRVYFKADS